MGLGTIICSIDWNNEIKSAIVGSNARVLAYLVVRTDERNISTQFNEWTKFHVLGFRHADKLSIEENLFLKNIFSNLSKRCDRMTSRFQETMSCLSVLAQTLFPLFSIALSN